jgi:hypothetical protein
MGRTKRGEPRAAASPTTLAAVLALLAALLVLPLALAPRAEAFIYWVNNRTGTIGRANLDGTGIAQRFMDVGITRDLTLDSEHIYWVPWCLTNSEATCSMPLRPRRRPRR